MRVPRPRPHARGGPSGVAENTSNLWHFPFFQRAACIFEAGVGIRERRGFSKMSWLPGHLYHESALVSSELVPPLPGARRPFVSSGREGRFDVSSKRKDETTEG